MLAFEYRLSRAFNSLHFPTFPSVSKFRAFAISTEMFPLLSLSPIIEESQKMPEHVESIPDRRIRGVKAN